MIEAKCAHCGNHSFQLTHNTTIQGDTHSHHLVVCSRCQSPCGLLSQIDPGVESRRIKNELDQIHHEIQALTVKVGHIARLLEESSTVPTQ